MAKKFDELRAKMSPKARQHSEQYLQELLAEMPLHELRQAQGLSQTELAERLHINQAAVSKMERRTDMYISSLRKTIQAMGGDLEIIAKFPHDSVKISHFSDVAMEE